MDLKSKAVAEITDLLNRKKNIMPCWYNHGCNIHVPGAYRWLL